MPYLAASKAGTYDPWTNTVFLHLTVWAQWVIHVVRCLLSLVWNVCIYWGNLCTYWPLSTCISLCHLSASSAVEGTNSPNPIVSDSISQTDHYPWLGDMTPRHACTRVPSWLPLLGSSIIMWPLCCLLPLAGEATRQNLSRVRNLSWYSKIVMPSYCCNDENFIFFVALIVVEKYWV